VACVARGRRWPQRHFPLAALNSQANGFRRRNEEQQEEKNEKYFGPLMDKLLLSGS